LNDLGEPEAVYISSGWRQAVCLACTLFCFAFAGFVGHVASQQPNKSPDAAFGLMAMAGIGGLFGLYLATSMGQLSYRVYPSALVEQRGKASTIIRWDQIREVYETIHPVWRKYRVVGRKGFDIELTGNIKNHVALAKTIEDRVVESRLPDALAELDRGGTVFFGPIGVSRDAFNLNHHRSPWSETRMAVGLNTEQVQGGYSNLMHLHVYTQLQARSLKTEINKVPNFRLFVELVRQRWPECAPLDV
jgi:hypothetical protein